MPKLKIGEKVSAGEGGPKEMKRFTNGHKTFTAMEAKILVETQTRERHTLEQFEQNIPTMIAPRNPITGEPTPRMVYDANSGQGTMSGELLFKHKLNSRGQLKTLKESEYDGEDGYTDSPMCTPGGTLRSARPGTNPLKREDRVQERTRSMRVRQGDIASELDMLKEEIKVREEQVRASSRQQIPRF